MNYWNEKSYIIFDIAFYRGIKIDILQYSI